MSTDRMIAAVKKFRGGLYLAAEHLGCTARQIRDRAETDEGLEAVIDLEKGKIDDRAELGLVKAIQDGEPWAIRFRLKHASDRGYVEKSEVDANIDDASGAFKETLFGGSAGDGDG